MNILNKLKTFDINYYWLLSFSFAFLLCFFIDPSLSYDAQFDYESASLYLNGALNLPFLKNLMAPEATYLVMFQRVLSYIIVRIFPLLYFPYILNITGLIIFAFFISVFCSKENRFLIKSDSLRFIFSIVIVLFPTTTDAAIGMVGYFLSLLITLLMFQNKENFSTFKYIFYLLFISILINKIHTLVVIPFVIVAILYHLKHKQFKSMFFWIPSIIMLLFNLIYLIKTSSSSRYVRKTTAAPDLTFIEFLYSRLVFSLKAYFSLFTTIINYYALSALTGLIIFIIILFVLYKKNSQQLFNKVTLFILSAFSISFLTTYLSHLGYANRPIINMHGTHAAGILFSFALITFIYNYIPKSFYQKLAIFFVFLIIIIQSYTMIKLISYGHRSTNRWFLFSWPKSHVLLQKSDYYIPSAPHSWASIIKNNKYLYEKIDGNGIFKTSEEALNTSNKIRALIVRNDNNGLLYAIAYDKDNKIIGKAEIYSDVNRSNYIFLNFDGDRVPAASIKFFDANNQEVFSEITMIVGTLP